MNRVLTVTGLLGTLLLGAGPARASGPEGSPLRLLLAAFPEGEGPSRVAVLVTLDREALDPGAQGTVGGTIDVTFLRGAEPAGGFHQPFALDAERTAALRASAGLQVMAEVSLPPGHYRVRAEARTETGGELTGFESELTVPQPGGPAPVLSPPLFPEPLDRWLTFRADTGSSEEARPYPFVLPSGEAFLPAVRPVLAAGQEVDFHLFAEGLGAGPVALEGAVYDAGGQEVHGPRVFLLDRRPRSAAGSWLLEVGFRPGGLAAGDYRLALRVGDLERGESEWSSLPFRVTVPETVREAATEEGTVPVPEPGEEEEGALSGLTGLDSGPAYRRILQQLATEGFPAALASLKTFEIRRTRHLEVGEMQALRYAEVQVALAVGGRSAPVLLTLFDLHARAFLRYLDEGGHWLAAHSRLVFEALARAYLEVGSSPATRRQAADTLAALSTAEPGLRVALEIDPDNALALIRLALESEKHGRYEDALTWLRRLSAAQPDHPECLLRTAVQLRRLGRREEAARVLDHLFETDGGEPWILELGTQERATLALERGAEEEARQILRDGSKRWSGNQRLPLRLALLEDRSGQREAAGDVVDRMVDGPLDPGESPRHRYTRGPVDDVEAVRAALDAAGEAGLPALRAALGLSGEGGTW